MLGEKNKSRLDHLVVAADTLGQDVGYLCRKLGVVLDTPLGERVLT